jgi:hypothetical protein
VDVGGTQFLWQFLWQLTRPPTLQWLYKLTWFTLALAWPLLLLLLLDALPLLEEEEEEDDFLAGMVNCSR